MKKSYTKPMFTAEDFLLEQHVAAGCDTELGTPLLGDAGSCRFDWWGVQIFPDRISCEFPADEIEGYCYYNSGDGVKLAFFSS